MVLYALIVVLVLLTSAYILLWYYKRRHLRRIANKLEGKSTLPFLGNAMQFWCKPEELLDRINDLMIPFQTSPTRAWIGPKLYICIFDPENVKLILSSKKCLHKDDVYRFLQTLGGQGLISGSGEIWRQHRKLIEPTFNNVTLTQYLEIFQNESKTLVDILSAIIGQDSFDILQLAQYCSINVVMETVLDAKVNAQRNPNNKLVKALEEMYPQLHTRMLKVWLHPDFMFYRSALGKNHLELVKIIRDYLRDGLRKKYQELLAIKDILKFENNNQPDRNICTAEYLMKYMELNPGAMNEEEFIDEMATLFLASQDTTSSNYSYVMLFCGMYPEVQQKIYTEIQNELGDKDNLEIADLNKLTYMDMVLNECLRLIPIGPFILRKIESDFELVNCTIPANAGCLVNIYALHRDPKQWEKPNTFYPEHFLGEAVAKRHPFSFLPFSSGPRKCIGKLYAIYLIKTMLVHSLRKFRVEANGKFEDLKIYSDISCRITGGCQVKLHER